MLSEKYFYYRKYNIVKKDLKFQSKKYRQLTMVVKKTINIIKNKYKIEKK